MDIKKIIIISAIVIVVVVGLGMVLQPPVTGGRLSSMWGIRFVGTFLHPGSDIAHSVGAPINPVAKGTIKEAGYDDMRGNFIRIGHIGIVESRYYHLDSIWVNRGDNVNHKNIIGTVGNTGYSTGPHLHYEIRLFGIPLPPFLLCLPGTIFKHLSKNIEIPAIL